MSHVLVIADLPTGKLIQKYLLREPYEVDHFSGSGIQEFPIGEYDVVIVDATRSPQELDEFLIAIRQRTQCASIVLLRSMETEGGYAAASAGVAGARVVTSTKPVKFSELARIIHDELAATHV